MIAERGQCGQTTPEAAQRDTDQESSSATCLGMYSYLRIDVEKRMDILFLSSVEKKNEQQMEKSPLYFRQCHCNAIGVEKKRSLATIRKQLLLLKPVIGVPRLHSATTILLPGSQ